MNTTKKGDIFEEQVLSIMIDLLNDPGYYLNSKTSKIIPKKSYYSEARKGNIIFDIAIESYFKDADEYSMLTIIECKNLSHPVPVDDIEEFESKLNQIGANNSKGIIFSKSGFQKGTYNIAKSKGIGLVNVGNGNQLDWINLRQDKSVKIENIVERTGERINNSFFATNGRLIFRTLPDLLIDFGIIDLFKNKSKFIPIPYLDNDRITQIVIDTFPIEIYGNDVLNVENICDFLTKEFKVKFEFNKKIDDDILGIINLRTLEININPNLKKDIYRWRFTLAHEIGHLILHKKLLSAFLTENVDTKGHISLNLKTLDFNKRMEVQANIFAATLLLPFQSLKYDVAQYFVDNNIKRGYLFLDGQQCNRSLVFPLLGLLQRKYQVSKEVAKLRLKQLNILRDKSDISIKSIMREIE